MPNTPVPAPRVVTMRDLLAKQFPYRDHLVFPWLRQGESAMLWAASGVGKTMLSLTLALAVAGGGEVLGWRNETPRRVLLVDGEMHSEDLKDRLAMLRSTVARLDVESAADNLRIMSRHMDGGAAPFPDITQPEGQKAVLGAARKHGADLVLLDNFSTLSGGLADENDAAAFGPVLEFLLQLKANNVACLLVHHSDKPGNNYRGSSKLATTFEVILGLKKLRASAPEDGATFVTEWTKFRGRPHASTRPAECRLEDGTLEDARWTHRPIGDAVTAELLEAVRSGCYQNQAVLGSALGLRPDEVTRRKQRAIKEGLITTAEWERYVPAKARKGASDNAPDDDEF